MRVAFTQTLLAKARRNKKIMLLTGDLGYSIFEDFLSELPEQFVNMGVSEQNMTGVAAGLAFEGKIPVVYSIIPFVTMRNFEQIRNDICYQNANVKIVGVGSGFSYGPYAHSHHALEDIGILRTLANLTILTPCDPLEVKAATIFALSHSGPVYIRLGKAGEPMLNKKGTICRVGKGNVLKRGKDITIFAMGAIAKPALDTATLLEKKGLSVSVVSMYSIKPIDQALILRLARTSKALFTLEEHSVIGGLGSAVSEILAENNQSVIFKRIGVPDRFTKKIGMQEFMREANGLSPEQVTQTILVSLSKK